MPEEAIQQTRINEVKVEDRSLDGLGNMLASGLNKPVPTQDNQEIPQSKVDVLVKGLEQKAEESNVTTALKLGNGAEIIVETPEQIKIKEKEVQIETIKADLNKSEEEKLKAVSELKEASKPKKYWEEKDESNENGAADSSKEKEPEYKEWEQKAKEYDEILKDPAVDALISARKAGKDFTSFLKDVQPIDVDKIPLSELMKEQLKRENLSAEAIESEMEAFEGMSERAKVRETKEIKATLQSEQQNRLSKYSLDNKQAAIKSQEWIMGLNKEKEQYLESIKGKVKEGVEMTSARLPELKQDFENFNLRRKDGTLDVPRVMRIILLEKYNSLRLENAYQQGRTERELEGWQEITRPSASNGLNIAPEVKNKSSQKQETEQNLKTLESMYSSRGSGQRVSN